VVSSRGAQRAAIDPKPRWIAASGSAAVAMTEENPTVPDGCLPL